MHAKALTETIIKLLKAFMRGRRLAYKDYVDWYFLLNGGHVTLAEVLALAAKKFGSEFNDRLFLGQLVSFEDVPTQKIDFLGGEVDRAEIESFLKDTVRNFKM